MERLLKVEEVAKLLGVPRKAVRDAAEQHGYLTRIGRCVRINPDHIPELLEKCLDPAKAPASSTRADRGVYIIRDGERRLSTGTSDRREAESALAAYIAQRDRPVGPSSPDKMTVADCLDIYGREHAPTVRAPAPYRIRYRGAKLDPRQSAGREYQRFGLPALHGDPEQSGRHNAERIGRPASGSELLLPRGAI